MSVVPAFPQSVPRGSGRLLIERHDGTASEQTGQVLRAGHRATPEPEGLRRSRSAASCNETAAVPALGGDERAGVVDDHALRRDGRTSGFSKTARS